MPSNTPESAWPVHQVSKSVSDWISRLGEVWVEAQVVDVRIRPGAPMVFCVLRDVEREVSVGATIRANLWASLPTQISDGARALLLVKPYTFSKTSQLQFEVREIRPVGVGELLAQMERLKQLLASEGLFDKSRKKPLPFLPTRVGLICGREAAAKQDVIAHASGRWPAVEFEIREVAVQGANCIPEVTAALRELEQDPQVDVIIVARGGGALEHLLPFSEEGLVRLVSKLTTPVISAIGHEEDSPLLDHVADWRASTPTDAGKRVVPDLVEEIQGLAHARRSLLTCIDTRLDREQGGLEATRRALGNSDPAHWVEREQGAIHRGRDMIRQRIARVAERETAQVEQWGLSLKRGLAERLTAASNETSQLEHQLRALSPQGVLDRGYAVVRDESGTVVRDSSALIAGEPLSIRFAQGQAKVAVTGVAVTGDGEDA